MRFIFLLRCVAALSFVCAVDSSIAGNLTVSAAASLTNAFKEIAQAYQSRYPEVQIALNFGASGALLQQLAKGAPVDVFASADQESMNMAEKQGLVAAADRKDFVRNLLVLIAPVDSKLSIKQLGDLGRADIKRIAIGNPVVVPAGRYAKHALDSTKLWSAVESKIISTQNVRQSLDYVARGEVDASFVYATDALIMKDKVKVVLQAPLDMTILYPIAKTLGSANTAEAQRFVSFVLSPAGQAILMKFGFQKS